MKRIWRLRDGQHLCDGWFGVGSNEYGYKTWWVRVWGGVLVYAVRRWTWDEVLADADGDVDLALRDWDDYKQARIEDGWTTL